MTEKRLTYQDVADRWTCGEDKVRRLVAAGVLRCIRLGYRTVRFNPTEIERFEKICTDA